VKIRYEKGCCISEAHLFSPRPAYRFQFKGSTLAEQRDASAGENPPYGAAINYYLKSSPKKNMNISILDENGQTVRILSGSRKVGINRIWWDLRYEASTEPKLRTSPIFAPHVKVGPEVYRSIRSWGGRISPLVTPGSYTVKLTIDSKEFRQDLEVKKDPNSEGSEEDIRAQTKLLLEMRDSSSEVADMINQIEWIRKQIYDLKALLEEDKDTAEIQKSSDDLDKLFISVEENLFQMRLSGSSQDMFRFPIKLYGKLGGLAGGVGRSDFAPTTQQIEVYGIYKKQVADTRSKLDELLQKSLPAFHQMLTEKNITNIVNVKIK
jgi:hypothetical protein